MSSENRVAVLENSLLNFGNVIEPTVLFCGSYAPSNTLFIVCPKVNP